MFEQLLKADQIDVLVEKPPAPTTPSITPPSIIELEQILDSFSAAAIQYMMAQRGITARKKSEAVRQIARIFYSPERYSPGCR